METVPIQTAQNVTIDYPVASIGHRMLAWLIDFCVIAAYFLLVNRAVSISNIMDASSTADAITILALYLPIIFYHLASEILLNGRSLGKLALRLRVVRLDGSRPSWGSYFARWVTRSFETQLFGLFGGPAILAIALSSKGQRMGDRVGGTTVVRVQKLELLSLQELLASLEESNYKPLFPQVSKLSDQDIDIVQEAMRRYRTNGDSKPVRLVADKIGELLGVQVEPTPLEFLDIIVKDYTQVTARL